MENNTIRNYDQYDRNYQDIHIYLEKSELNQKPQNEEGFEEFTNDQPNRFNHNDRNINTPNHHWKVNKGRTENDFEIDFDLYENYRDVYRRNPVRRDNDL